MSEKQNKHFYIDSDLLDYLKEVKTYLVLIKQ